MSAGLFHVYYNSINHLGIPVTNGFYFAALSASDALYKFSSYANVNLGGVPNADIKVELVLEAGNVSYGKGSITISSD